MIAAGRIAGLFGAQGGVTLDLYSDFPRDFNTSEEPVFVKIEGHRVPLFFADSSDARAVRPSLGSARALCAPAGFRRRGAHGATAVFDDIDTVPRASELIGLEFFIARTQSPLPFDDFIGWAAVLNSNQTGQITNFLDSELNPLFEITLDACTATELIPAQFVEKIDTEHQIVIFEIPDGLLGLNE